MSGRSRGRNGPWKRPSGAKEAAKDCSEGLRYNNFGFHGSGLSTAVDSLAAVRACVYEDGSLTKERLFCRTGRVLPGPYHEADGTDGGLKRPVCRLSAVGRLRKVHCQISQFSKFLLCNPTAPAGSRPH
ncbi:MAG: hypothetical protein IJL72_05210 [Lachnospiraceae bacterium]|nr:hypothetical protein [Lachnospiraceae bacterium]